MNRKLKTVLFLILAQIISFGGIVQASTLVQNLRTEYLQNPVGIDERTPHFSWEMTSDERGASQTAYEITVSFDSEGDSIAWKSGRIDSDKSLNIKYGGDALLPRTRYYWHINVWDHTNTMITSTETSYFETGLLDSGWGDAKWINATTEKQGVANEDPGTIDPSTITDYTINMDFEIKAIAAGPSFGMKDAGNFFMWQINIEGGSPVFRPHSWLNGGGANHEDKDISALIDIQKDVTYALKIEIKGDKATTYIDGIMIDENRINPRGGNYGFAGLGFRQDKAQLDDTLEEAFFDNIKVTTVVDGQEITMFSDDFSAETNTSFSAGTVIDGRLLVNDRALSIQKESKPVDPGSIDPATITDYTINMDFEIKAIAAGPSFGMKDAGNFFMWQINIEGGSPVFRPHSWLNGGGANHEDKDISALIDIQKDVTYALKIDINGDKATTYIDGIMIDENRINPRGGNYGFAGLGFRQDKAQLDDTLEEAFFDNIKVTTVIDGQEITMFSDDFSAETNTSFSAGTVIEGRLLVNDRALSIQKESKAVDPGAIDPSTITDYTINMDFAIKAIAAGPCFGMKDANNFFMWQINIEGGSPVFRPHSWLNGGGANHEDKDISALIDIQKDVTYALKIDINGDKATTYIDGIMIDENRINPRGGNYGFAGLGFRQDKAQQDDTLEEAFFDNIKVTTEIEGQEITMFSDDFSAETNYSFSAGTVIDGRLLVNDKALSIQEETTPVDPESIDPASITDYTINMDFEIKAIAAGPSFGMKDAGNFFMWQINIEGSSPLFRPHSWLNGGGANHEDKDISALINIQKDVTYTLKIDIKGDKATTYIDGILIDEDRTNPRGGNYGFASLGFRQAKAEFSETNEEAYYDNIKVTTVIDGQEISLFSDDFSGETNTSFSAGTVIDGRLLVNDQALSMQKKENAASEDFTLDMDITLKSGNAGIIFSASDISNLYMWSINTYDNPEPIIRRHFYVGGNPATSEVAIGQHFSKEDLIDHERHVKIEVIDNVIKTFIDDVLVDEYKDNSGVLHRGYIGFRAHSDADERAYYDNIVLKDENGEVIFSEDFENGSNSFDYTETIAVDGDTKLYIYSPSGESKVLQSQANGIPMFRTEFTLEQEVVSARIYSAALGVFDLFINGERVGTPQADGSYVYDELKPGATDYNKRTYYMTYDVTKLLQSGENAIGAQVSSGWWNGNIAHGIFGGRNLAFITKLIVTFADGSTKTIDSDPSSWLSSNSGPMVIADIYNGEIYDARNEKNWTVADFDVSTWNKTAVNTEFKGVLTGYVGTTVQVRPEMELEPLSITTYNKPEKSGSNHGEIEVINTINGQGVVSLKTGETAVYDFGQNMVGWVKFSVQGTSGTKMKLRFGEMLNTTGNVSRGDDGPTGSIYTANLRGAKASLYYTLNGEENESYNPSMTYYGFRYCEVTASQDIEIKSMVGQIVGNVNNEGSTMETNNDLVNQLYQNVIWGQRGNFLSVPTDCPQRDERLGWTGDAQVFCRTAAYNADVASFFHKWMNDMRDSQREDGAYPVIAPYSWDVGYGAGAWSEAGIIVPWTIYQMYADKGILEENFESMEKYMGYLAAQGGNGYQYNGAGTPYGDWLSKENTDSRYVSVCYYAYAAKLMSKISTALSETENDAFATKASEYQTLFNNIKTEFQQRYVNNAGTLKQTSQTSILLALKLDLYDNEIAQNSDIELLRNKIVNNGNKLTTGFIGTGTLNQTLSEFGETETAYNLLLQRDYPSWLYSVDQGATTIWERWDTYTVSKGFNTVVMNSFNHYSYGAVAEWMYRYMAGIDVDESNPGFKHIIIKPNPDFRNSFPAGQSAITNVKAKHCSYYGDIESSWKRNDEESITFNLKIPANTTATLHLPLSSDKDEVYEGDVPAEDAEGVTFVSKSADVAIYTLGSGTYEFNVKNITGVEELKRSGNNSIYPNPANQILNFSKKVENYRIVSPIGNVLLSGSGSEVDVSSLSKGMYLIYLDEKYFKFSKN